MSTSSPGRIFAADVRATLVLAGPLILAAAGNQLMGLVDTVIVGHLGAVPLAGVGLGSSIYFLAVVLPMGLMMGLDPLVSQAIGAGRRGQARRHLREAVRVAAVISVPVIALIFAVAWLSLPALRIDAATSAAVYDFLLGRAPSVLPFLIYFAHRGYLQAEGAVRVVWVAAVVANVLNVPLVCLLAYGDEALTAVGLPAIGLGTGLGVFGAGLGSTLVTIAQVVMTTMAVRSLDVPGTPERPTWAGIRALLRVGLPVGVHFLAEGGLFCTVSLLMGLFGPAAVAGHQVALQLASFTFTICLGVGSAASVRVGHAVGRRDTVAARRAGFAGLVSSWIFMSGCALAFALGARPLATLVSDAPEVVAAAVPLLHIAAAFQIFDGTQVVAGSVLRGAADTRTAMLASLAGHWGLGFGLAMLLGFTAGMGPVGLWWGLTLGLAATGSFLTLRFERLSRRPIASVV